MTAEKRKRLKSVKYVNNPISKPDSEREKGVQAGRSLVVSRARPTFCQFCKIRHSSLACPVVNPVQTTSLPASLPASDDQTRNPPTNPRTLREKTKRCRRCSRQQPLIINGMLIERTLLCEEHKPDDPTPDPATESGSDTLRLLTGASTLPDVEICRF